MTSLEMHGVSITICKLKEDIEKEVLKYIDLEVETKYFKAYKPQSLEEIYVNPKMKIEKIME